MVLSLCCFVLGIVLALGWVPSSALAGETAAPAAERPAERPAGSSIAADTAIASDKLLQFANAYQQVLQIIDRREVEIKNAETDYLAARILRDGEAEALSVIQAAGLSWSEYVQMLNLANLDSEFGEEVAVALQELDAAPRTAQLAPAPAKPLGSKIN